MLYSIHCLDHPDTHRLRAANRKAHLAHLDLWNDKLFFSGPLLDDNDESIQCGSLFILEVENRAEAETFLHDEVYFKSGIFAKVSIVRMRKGRHNPQLVAEISK
jgi:uncharacterized protein